MKSILTNNRNEEYSAATFTSKKLVTVPREFGVPSNTVLSLAPIFDSSHLFSSGPLQRGHRISWKDNA